MEGLLQGIQSLVPSIETRLQGRNLLVQDIEASSPSGPANLTGHRSRSAERRSNVPVVMTQSLQKQRRKQRATTWNAERKTRNLLTRISHDVRSGVSAERRRSVARLGRAPSFLCQRRVGSTEPPLWPVDALPRRSRSGGSIRHRDTEARRTLFANPLRLDLLLLLILLLLVILIIGDLIRSKSRIKSKIHGGPG